MRAHWEVGFYGMGCHKVACVVEYSIGLADLLHYGEDFLPYGQDFLYYGADFLYYGEDFRYYGEDFLYYGADL